MSVSDSFLLLERISKAKLFANAWGSKFLGDMESMLESSKEISSSQKAALGRTLKEIESSNKYRRKHSEFDNSDPKPIRGCTTCKKTGIIILGSFSFRCLCPKGKADNPSLLVLDEVPADIHRIVALHDGHIGRSFTRLEMVDGVRCFHMLSFVCKTTLPEGYPRTGRPQITYTPYSRAVGMRRLTEMVVKYHENPKYYHERDLDDPPEHDGTTI